MIEIKRVIRANNFKSIISLLCLAFFNYNLCAQELVGINELETSIEECSGLHFLEDRLIGIQDSGNPAEIYEINPETAMIYRTVEIAGATNTDWESITADDSHIYIADIGNNQGTRQDLRIYKISIQDYWDKLDVIESYEIISFSYADQENFDPNEFQTNFDAEAICSYGQSILLFSKNWGNSYSKIYEIPKEAGNYEISPIDSIDAQGLVTGCDCDHLAQQVSLIGHSNAFIPFSIRINNFDPSDLENAEQFRADLNYPEGASPQVESIAKDTEYLVASETLFIVPGWLYSLDWPGVLQTKEQNNKELFEPIYPNPSPGRFMVQDFNYSSIHILAENGAELYHSAKKEAYDHGLPAGTYIVVFKLNNEFIMSKKLVIIN